MTGVDPWAGGDDYERYIGRWSRLVAARFVDWLGVPAAVDWLDVGCGTGALTETILSRAEPRTIVGVDPSTSFVEHAASHVMDGRATFRVGSASDLPLDEASVDAAVAGLVLMLVPDANRAVQEMCRVTGEGGTVAAYLWDYAEGMQLIRRFFDAAIELDPAAVEKDEGARFAICQPGPLAELFRASGLRDVEVKAIEVATPFADFDDYWTPFLAGVGVAPAYLMTLEPERRAAIRERIRAAMPFEPDGSIQLTARAWAVHGRRVGATDHRAR